MKSQKRSHSDRAFSLWMNGWREGRQDQWSGYNSFAQAQRLSNL